MEKKNRKREGGKLKMDGGKLQKKKKEKKMRRGEDFLFFFFSFLFFFFFFFFSFGFVLFLFLFLLFTFKTTEICFGCTKMGIFYRKKVFHTGKKIRKMTLPSLKNIPLTPLAVNLFHQKDGYNIDYRLATQNMHPPGDFWRPLFFESLSIGKLKSGCLQKSPPWVKR